MKIYGVIGNPIRHTLSPFMHNAAFKKMNIKAAYLAFEAEREDLESIIRAMPKAGVNGLNVTIPYKEQCIKYLDDVDPLAFSIGAVNTVVVKKDNKIKGYNTDAHGFITAVQEDLAFNVKGKCIFILGSGGASRAVGFSCAYNGAKKLIFTDLYFERAESLAENIRRHYPLCEIKVLKAKKIYSYSDMENADLAVNSTPVGMGKKDPLMFDIKEFKKSTAVYDIVYNPRETQLVKIAKKNGLRASGGLSMLLYQGAKSLELWTGKKAPLEVMRRALEKAIIAKR